MCRRLAFCQRHKHRHHTRRINDHQQSDKRAQREPNNVLIHSGNNSTEPRTAASSPASISVGDDSQDYCDKGADTNADADRYFSGGRVTLVGFHPVNAESVATVELFTLSFVLWSWTCGHFSSAQTGENSLRTFAALRALCGKRAFKTINRKERQERKDHAKS
jgi:hypothetical protein